MLIGNIYRDDLGSALGTSWRAVSERVVGGVSRATLQFNEHAGRRCPHLSGNLRLENDGGLVQMALDVDPRGATRFHQAPARSARKRGTDFTISTLQFEH